MIPAELGYAEVHYGASLEKLRPEVIPGFWRHPKTKNHYLREMELFLKGRLSPKSVFHVKSQDIDKNVAIMHLTSIKNSYLLERSDKLATCAFLASKWFKYVDIVLGD